MIQHKNYYLSTLAEASMSYQRDGDVHNIDVRVKELIIQALQYNPDNEERSNIIKGLLALIEYLPNSLTENKLDEGLRPYYDEALKVTKRDIIRNLENFIQNYDFDINNAEPVNVRICFVRWYNQILKYDCIDKYRLARNRPKPVNLDQPVGEDGASTMGDRIPDDRNLPPMEQSIFDENEKQQQLLFDYINQDPDNRLRNCCPQRYLLCNCWELCQRRLLKKPPEQWQQIARDLNIPFGTVTSHWDRKCKPLLIEIANQFGFDGV
jgi:hypothetical protein